MDLFAFVDTSLGIHIIYDCSHIASALPTKYNKVPMPVWEYYWLCRCWLEDTRGWRFCCNKPGLELESSSPGSPVCSRLWRCMSMSLFWTATGDILSIIGFHFLTTFGPHNIHLMCAVKSLVSVKSLQWWAYLPCAPVHKRFSAGSWRPVLVHAKTLIQIREWRNSLLL